MVPIFEQGKGKGIGYSISTFHERFDELCREHLRLDRAKAFAFIFYDFNNREFKRILKDQGVFAQLDRLSGDKLSLFYLHSHSPERIAYFNSHFMSKLGVAGDATPPCVVFFKLEDDKVGKVAIAQLDNANLIHGFNELYGVVEQYIKSETCDMEPRSFSWIKSGAGFIQTELFRAMLRKAIDQLL